MAAYSARAIVLKRTRLGEADLIITLLAEDGRQIRAVAKGVRKPTSKFGGRLEPGAEVDLLLHTGRTLDVISEVRTVRPHAGVRGEFERQVAAAVVEDVLENLTRDGESDPRLFGLADASLTVLETADRDLQLVVVVAFLLKAMAMHGYRPELEDCVACAGAVGSSEHFSLSAGGVVCASCGTDAAALQRLSIAGRAWLERLLVSKMAELPELEMPLAAAMDCFELVRAFVAYHLPTRLKALDFYVSAAVSPRTASTQSEG